MSARELAARALRLHPPTTVRWRLTLLYAGLFLACGAALLAITYTLVAHATVTTVGPRFVVAPGKRTGLRSASPRASTRSLRVPGKVQFRGAALPPRVRQLLRSSAGKDVVRIVGSGQRISDLHELIIWSAIALAIMAVVSAALGWLVAGRVLAPLRTITATTREISEANLHQRLAVPGPRDELRQLADTIDALLARLEGAFDAQRRFVANASHELRTPLTVTRALLEMALEDPHATIDSFRDTCRQALDENEQQEQLIDALLTLAQGQRGIEQRELLDPAAIATEALSRLTADATAHGVRLGATTEPALVSGDRRLLERLVSNLLDNAIRHNVRGGRAALTVRSDGGQARLTVENDGPAVPATEIERLLQPFQRLSDDRVGDRGGLGLGLSIVAAIAAAHDAALEVRPAAGGGLAVDVRFPAVAEASADAVLASAGSQARGGVD